MRAVNPDIVYCHTSSYGPRGPRADWPGYDQLFQSSCGWEVAGAGEGNPPMWHRLGFMDHLCAMGSVIVDAARAVPPRPHRRRRSSPPARCWRGGVHDQQRDLPRRRRQDRADAGARPRADRHRARLPHPAGRRRMDRDRRHHRRASSPALCTVAGVDRVGGRRRRARRPRGAEALAALARAGVPCEEVRLDQKRGVLRLARQRRRRDDRALPTRRLRRRSSSRARSGPSAISTSASTARRRDSASTPSRCSTRSVSTPTRSTRCSPTAPRTQWKAGA